MAEQVVSRRGREGGRWINERPSSQEFAEWFTTSMKLDHTLTHEDYIGGVVLIPAVDTKAPYVTGFTQQGVPVIEHREELSYIPYAKVETRTAYYWDLLDVHPEWVGVVEHVTPPRLPIDFVTEEERRLDAENPSSEIQIKRRQPGAMTVLTHQLPDGFSIMSVPVGQNYTHFLCCTVRVSIFKADEAGEPKGRPLRTGRGTKQVPLVMGRNTVYADPSSLMKAETGAFGRALGFAGIFVIPGSGVATAEDMIEAMAQGAPPAEAAPSNQGPAAPDQAPVRTGSEQAQGDEEQLRARAITLYKALEAEHPGAAGEFTTWAQQRRLRSLGDARGATLKGVVKKLERLTDEADRAAQQAPETEGSDVEPAQTPAAEPSDQPG